jgi:hypothetical protein
MGDGDHWRWIFGDLETGIQEVVGWASKGAMVGQREYSTLPIPDGMQAQR